MGELQVTARSRSGELIGGSVVAGEDLRRFDKTSLDQALDLVPSAAAGNSGGSGDGPRYSSWPYWDSLAFLSHTRWEGGAALARFGRDCAPRQRLLADAISDPFGSSSAPASAPRRRSEHRRQMAEHRKNKMITTCYVIDIPGSPFKGGRRGRPDPDRDSASSSLRFGKSDLRRRRWPPLWRRVLADCGSQRPPVSGPGRSLPGQDAGMRL